MCTSIRFNGADGSMYFGRNLDWVCGYGESIDFSPRHLPYRSVLGAPQRAEGFAVVGVGVCAQGRPLYFDCANERGLAVAGLNFPGYADFPHEPVDGVDSVATFELPYWICRNFETVDELAAALEHTDIVSLVVPGKPESFLHWMVADASRSIVIERTATGLHVYDNTVDTLANQPEFGWHLENLRNYMTSAPEFAAPVSWGRQELAAWGAGVSMRGIPGDACSPSRFVRAAYTNAHYPVKDNERENVSRLFHTLGGVQMVEGTAAVSDGRLEKTLFTSGYSSSTNTYYVNSYDDFAIRAFPMSDFDQDGIEIQTRPMR